MSDQKTVLVVAPGYNAKILRAPRDMGFRCVVVASAPPEDDDLYDHFIQAWETDEAAVLAAVKDYVQAEGMVDAVACFVDGSIHVAAALSQELGLPGNSPDAVRAMRDKFLTWQALDRAGVPTARTRMTPSVKKAQAAAEDFGYPVILKPQASAASQGVTKVGTPGELMSAFEMIKDLFEQESFGEGQQQVRNIGQNWFMQDARSVLVQEFLEGEEIYVDVVYGNGKFTVLGIFDKPQEWDEPYFVERVAVIPSRLPEDTQNQVRELCVEALRAVGVTTGSAHIEFRITADGPKLIEINGRIGGSAMYVQEAMRATTGLWGPAEHVRVMMGEDPPDIRVTNPEEYVGFVNLYVEEVGWIVHFEGEEEVRRLPGFMEMKWSKKVGQYIPEGYPRNPDIMFAHVMCRNESYDELVRTLHRVQQALRVVTSQ
jgi:biotin carboxylase